MAALEESVLASTDEWNAVPADEAAQIAASNQISETASPVFLGTKATYRQSA
jgi:hypothetical protein